MLFSNQTNTWVLSATVPVGGGGAGAMTWHAWRRVAVVLRWSAWRWVATPGLGRVAGFTAVARSCAPHGGVGAVSVTVGGDSGAGLCRWRHGGREVLRAVRWC
jgi:hypothetical protein